MEINGFKFFKDPASCINNYNKTSTVGYAFQTIQSIANTLLCIPKVMIRNCSKQNITNQFINVPEKGFQNRKLVVCLHGFGNNPLQLTEVVSEIAQKKLPIDIYAPQILDRGTSLDDAVAPIFLEIEKWSKHHHNQELELVLVGLSNGGRVGRALDAKLGNLKNITKFCFVSIVGACKGSLSANIANTLGIGAILGKNVQHEMPVNSVRHQQLDKEWEASLKATPFRERQYICFASPHDFLVPNYSSTLLQIPDPNAMTQYAIVPGHSHNSMINAVGKTVAAIVSKSN